MSDISQHSTSRGAVKSGGMPSLRALLTLLTVLLLAAVPFIAPSMQLLINLALAKGIAVLGVTVLLRAGQVSFGHALFFGISAYAGAFLMASLPAADLILVLIAGVIGAALSGLLVGLFVVRYRGIFFGMLNLAFSMIFWSILEKFYHVTGRRRRHPPPASHGAGHGARTGGIRGGDLLPIDRAYGCAGMVHATLVRLPGGSGLPDNQDQRDAA